MQYQETSSLNHSQKIQISELWNREYPVNIRHQQLSDFEAYLGKLHDSQHRILLDQSGLVCAWLVDFIREGQPWFAMLVAAEHQRKGLGKRLLREAMKDREVLHGWVVADTGYLKQDGSPYYPPLGFYRKMGFKIHTNTVLETDTLETIMVRWARS